MALGQAVWVACGACVSGAGAKGSAADASAEVLAHVGDHPVTKKDFDGYLAATLGGPGEVEAAGAELKSRLLDQYLEDEMLVSAAVDAGVKVTDAEIKEFQPPGAAVDENAIRRILLVREFKKKVVLGGVTVSEEEIRKYFDEHLDDYRQPANVVFRQILMDNAGEAKKVRAELSHNPGRFEEVAETRSLAPDGGKPYPLEMSLLPDSLRKALDGLQEGELSEVVQDPQGYFIFRLEERKPEKAPSFEEARQRIELKLLQDKSQKKYDETVAELKGRTKVAIQLDKLGFSYMKKNQS